MSIIRISDELRFALSEGPDGDVYDVPQDPAGLCGAIGRQLEFYGYYTPGSPESQVLLALVDPLEEWLAGRGPKDPTDWAQRLLVGAVKDMTREDVCDAMRAFGWDHDPIEGQPPISGLAKVIKRMLINRMAPLIVDMVDRWRAAGMFDQVHRRRAMRPPHDRRDTIDRATSPRYTPPGRV